MGTPCECVVGNGVKQLTYNYESFQTNLWYNYSQYQIGLCGGRPPVECGEKSVICRKFNGTYCSLGNKVNSNIKCGLFENMLYFQLYENFCDVDNFNEKSKPSTQPTNVYVKCSYHSNITQIIGNELYIDDPHACPFVTPTHIKLKVNTVKPCTFFRDLKKGHPDIDQPLMYDFDIVEKYLDENQLPIYNSQIAHTTVQSNLSFDTWFQESPCRTKNDVFCNVLTKNRLEIQFMKLDPNPYLWVYYNKQFFPLDNIGYGNDGLDHNYGFVGVIRFNVTSIQKKIKMTLASNDDSWLFMNGTLYIDNGGTHEMIGETVQIETKSDQDINEISIFYAERSGNNAALYIAIDGHVQECNGLLFQERSHPTKKQPIPSKTQTRSIQELTGSSSEQTSDIEDQSCSSSEQISDIEDQSCSSSEQTSDIEDQSCSSSEQTSDIKDQSCSSSEQTSYIEDQSCSSSEQTSYIEDHSCSSSEQTSSSPSQTSSSDQFDPLSSASPSSYQSDLSIPGPDPSNSTINPSSSEPNLSSSTINPSSSGPEPSSSTINRSSSMTSASNPPSVVSDSVSSLILANSSEIPQKKSNKKLLAILTGTMAGGLVLLLITGVISTVIFTYYIVCKRRLTLGQSHSIVEMNDLFNVNDNFKLNSPMKMAV